MFATLLSGELAALEIGNVVVQYARGGKIPSQWFDGREYPWDAKQGVYGRWATSPSGVRYFIPFEKIVERAKRKREPSAEEFATMIGRQVEDEATRQTILDNMRAEEARIAPMLAARGRTILSDKGRTADVRVDDAPSLPTFEPKYANKTVDLYKTIPNTGIKRLVLRRVYDENGVVLQDFHYVHSKWATHIFPHIHVCFGPNEADRSEQVEYR